MVDETIDDKVDKGYIPQKLGGHLVGAALSVGTAYLLGSTPTGILAAAGAEEAMDYAGDKFGYHSLRYLYESDKDKYKGISGKSTFLGDSLKLMYAEAGGDVLAKAAAYAGVVAMVTQFSVPLVTATIGMRIAEPIIETIGNYFFAKDERASLATPSHKPS